jgi:hypothetical protein
MGYIGLDVRSTALNPGKYTEQTAKANECFEMGKSPGLVVQACNSSTVAGESRVKASLCYSKIKLQTTNKRYEKS